MKILIFLAFVALASCDYPMRSDWKEIPPASAAPDFPEAFRSYPKLDSDGRIVNGQVATMGQFPFQILQYMQASNGNWFFCGAVIISNAWVITAAHCYFQRVNLELYAGIIDRQANAQWFSGRLPSSRWIMHPQYNHANLINDIALARPNSNIPFSSTVNSVPLPLRSQVGLWIVGWAATASGFGATQTGGAGSRHLRWWTQPIAANQPCQNHFGGFFRPEQTICIDPSVTRQSACQGDSGGPLTINASGRRVFGLFSYTSSQGCDRGFPEGWVRVTHYLDWIHSHTGLVQ